MIEARRERRLYQHHTRVLRTKKPLGQRIKRLRTNNDFSEETHCDQFEMWVMQRAFDSKSKVRIVRRLPNIFDGTRGRRVDGVTQLVDISQSYFDNSLIRGDDERYRIGPSAQAANYDIPDKDDYLSIANEVEELVDQLRKHKQKNNFDGFHYLKKLKLELYEKLKAKLRVMYARGNFTTTYSFLYFTRLWGKLEDHYYYTYHDIHRSSLLIPLASIRCRYDQLMVLYNHIAEGKAQTYLVWLLVDYEVNSTMYDIKLPRNIKIKSKLQNICFIKAINYQVELVCRQFNPRPPIIPIDVKRFIRNLVLYKNNPKYIC